MYVWSLVCMVGIIYVHPDIVLRFYVYFFFNCSVSCLSTIVWTPAALGVLYACVVHFCICTWSAQLSMFHMERHCRNMLIAIITKPQNITPVPGNTHGTANNSLICDVFERKLDSFSLEGVSDINLGQFLITVHKIWGFPTRMVYLYNDIESRYTILVGNLWYALQLINTGMPVIWHVLEFWNSAIWFCVGLTLTHLLLLLLRSMWWPC